MANRDFEDRDVRKLSKRGPSVGLTLPIELVRKLGWRVKQRVTVKRFGKNKLVVESACYARWLAGVTGRDWNEKS